MFSVGEVYSPQRNLFVQNSHYAQDHLSSSVSYLRKTTQQSPVPLSQESVQWTSLLLYAVLFVLYTEIWFAAPRRAATFTQSILLLVSDMWSWIHVETKSNYSFGDRMYLGETQLPMCVLPCKIHKEK